MVNGIFAKRGTAVVIQILQMKNLKSSILLSSAFNLRTYKSSGGILGKRNGFAF